MMHNLQFGFFYCTCLLVFSSLPYGEALPNLNDVDILPPEEKRHNFVEDVLGLKRLLDEADDQGRLKRSIIDWDRTAAATSNSKKHSKGYRHSERVVSRMPTSYRTVLGKKLKRRRTLSQPTKRYRRRAIGAPNFFHVNDDEDISDTLEKELSNAKVRRGSLVSDDMLSAEAVRKELTKVVADLDHLEFVSVESTAPKAEAVKGWPANCSKTVSSSKVRMGAQEPDGPDLPTPPKIRRNPQLVSSKVVQLPTTANNKVGVSIPKKKTLSKRKKESF
jgi:hypothetical protein